MTVQPSSYKLASDRTVRALKSLCASYSDPAAWRILSFRVSANACVLLDGVDSVAAHEISAPYLRVVSSEPVFDPHGAPYGLMTLLKPMRGRVSEDDRHALSAAAQYAAAVLRGRSMATH